MSGWIDLAWLIFLLAAAAWSVSTLLMPAVFAVLLRIGCEPAARSRRILLVSALPWLAPVSVLLAVLVTAGSKVLGWITDHCPHHGLDHPHLCFAHLPAIDLGVAHGATAGLTILVMLAAACRLVLSEYHVIRQVSLLKALAPSHRLLRIVPTRMLLAAASGIREPVVLLSRGLLDQLSFHQRRIVAAHEIAHLRSGDPRRNLLFEVLLLAHLPWSRRRLRAHWRRTLEEQADDAVAQRFGAESVVEALLEVSRMNLHASPVGLSIAGADPLSRGQRLLNQQPGRAARGRGFELTYALALLAVIGAAVTSHHALETALGLLAGR